MDNEDFEERFRRLELEATAEFEGQQKRKQAADTAERTRALELKKQELAMVRARTQELAEPGDDGDDQAPKPGFLSRLFGKKFSATDALEVANEARGELDKPRSKKEKSLLWSGGLSFFLGPVGWLYAGSFRESIPASILYLGAAAILQKFPSFLLMPVMGIALPISGLVGVAYAWRYNKKRKRVRMFGDQKKKELTG